MKVDASLLGCEWVSGTDYEPRHFRLGQDGTQCVMRELVTSFRYQDSKGPCFDKNKTRGTSLVTCRKPQCFLDITSSKNLKPGAATLHFVQWVPLFSSLGAFLGVPLASFVWLCKL